MGFALEVVEQGLAGTLFAGRVHHFPVTESTNTLGIAAAQAGTAAGVWVADEQTAGRGRGGHRWESAPGDGLLVSALFRPRLVGSDALKLSLAAGIASAQAVEAVTGLRPDVRWPNDLMITPTDGTQRKFGGILTETATQGNGELSYAVIGIGMNLNQARMPDDLASIATSLRLAGAGTVSREAMLVHLLRALAVQVRAVEAEAAGQWPQGTPPLAERFAAVSGWVRGLRVQVAEGDGYTGTTEGLDAQGLLLVRLEDGTIRKVRHGGARRA